MISRKPKPPYLPKWRKAFGHASPSNSSDILPRDQNWLPACAEVRVSWYVPVRYVWTTLRNFYRNRNKGIFFSTFCHKKRYLLWNVWKMFTLGGRRKIIRCTWNFVVRKRKISDMGLWKTIHHSDRGIQYCLDKHLQKPNYLKWFSSDNQFIHRIDCIDISWSILVIGVFITGRFLIVVNYLIRKLQQSPYSLKYVILYIHVPKSTLHDLPDCFPYLVLILLLS